MDAAGLTAALKDEAKRLGFDLVGVCPAVAPPRIESFRRWLGAGYAGQMRYLADRRAAYEHPRGVLEGAQSLVMLGLAYRTVEPHTPGEGQGRVSRYAWGSDYHDLVHDRLRVLAQHHTRLTPRAKVRGVVDTAPLLEREFAQLAGLGWIGKNTLLLNRRLGSWVFLAALLTTERLQYDRPETEGHCGACRACLDACPTGALVDAHSLDARKCISYLTIELGASIPRDLREPAGDWLFGCDACQEVCPWNRRAPIAPVLALRPLPGMNPVELEGLFALSEAAFRARFQRTPLWRAKRAGLLRNAAIVLGNRPHEPAIPALVRGLHDAEPMVRAACAWALGRHPVEAARAALGQRLAVERDPEVRGEIESSLSAC
jgi:epoxyqueuosine reductase